MFVAGAVILGRGIGRLVVWGRYGLSGVVVALLACVAAVGYGMFDGGTGFRGR